MKSPLYTEQLASSRPPVFMADSEGYIAEGIAAIIASEFLPIIVTRNTQLKREDRRAIVIPYKSRVPKIPDNNFLAIYFIQETEDVSNDLLTSLRKEAIRRSIPFFYIGPAREVKKKTLEDIFAYEKGKAFLFGELLGEGMSPTPTQSLIHEAKAKGSMTLSDQGLTPLFPVSKQFVIDGLIRYSLVESLPEQCIGFLPQGEVYEISLARLLQQMNHNLTIDFSAKKKPLNKLLALPPGCVIEAEPLANLKQTLQKEMNKKTQVKMPSSYRPTNPSVGRFWKSLSLLILIIVIFLSFAIFFITGMALFAERSVVRSVQRLSQLQIKEAKKSAKYAEGAFTLSSKIVQLASPALHQVEVLQRPVLDLEEKLTAGEKVAEMLMQVSDGAQVYQSLFQKGKSVDRKTFTQATQGIKNSLLNLSQLRAEGMIPQRYEKELSSHQKLIDLFLATSDTLPAMLGFGKQKTYLLLFQNNNELRPGGGFIGSFAVVPVHNGKIGELRIQDVYDADGQLKGHVEPPFALKRYLGVSHWYLRDSNFSSDFPESAANAAFFLNLETGKRADGVIAVDTSFLTAVVKAVGPIRLPNTDVVVTDKNIIELTQEKIEEEFFSGSSQKKQFLQELYSGLLQKLTTENSQATGKLIQALETSLLQKHILIAFSDTKLQEPLIFQGVSSTLQVPQKEEQHASDFFGVNEANLGANKVNMFISRRFFYDVSVTDLENVRVSVTETIENKSTPDTKYGGEYRVYVRLLLPENVSPGELLIDGVKQVILSPLTDEAAYRRRGEVAKDTLEVERIDEKGKSTYGFFIVVPAGSKKTITVSYVLHSTKSDPLGRYSLLFFKQPGTGPDPVRLSFSLSKDYSLLSSSVKLEKDNGRYVLLTRLQSDMEVDIRYAQK
ncbi:MAG: DUF4012 domain-containing protein [Candidatus Levybacteria bacterium]|nr:DUF4012 domain-containing protein [Candidatus Levybacteria bacterium]